MAVIQLLTSKLMVLMLYQLAVTHSGYTDEVSRQTLIQAVLNSYDSNRSLDDNVYSLLGIFCPESVYCPGEESDVNLNNQMQQKNFGTNWFINTTDVLNNNLDQITEARTILAENAHRIHGCCKHCSCTDGCSETNNCCPVLSKGNGRERNITDSVVKHECIADTIKVYIYNTSLMTRHDQSYYMVADCFSQSVSIEILTKCRHPSVEYLNQITPVYSHRTRRTYRNIFCATCNNDLNLISWQLRFIVSPPFTLTGKNRIPSTPEKLLHAVLAKSRSSDIIFIPPRPLLERKEQISCIKPAALMKECSHDVSFANDANHFFQTACSKYKSEYAIHFRTYGNLFCFLCSDKDYFAMSIQKCIIDLDRSGSKSFTGILVTGDRDTTDTNELHSDTGQCLCKEFFDQRKGVCLELICPPGQLFQVCKCKPFIDSTSGMDVILHMEIRTNLVLQELASSNVDVLIKKIRSAVTSTLTGRWKSIDTNLLVIFFNNLSQENFTEKIHFASLIRVKRGYDTLHELKSLYEALQNGINIRIGKAKMVMSLGTPYDLHYNHSKGQFIVAQNKCTFDSHHVIQNLLSMSSDDYKALQFTKQAVEHVQILSKLMFCMRVILSNDDIDTLHNLTSETGYTGLHLNYIYDKLDSSMCLDEYENMFVHNLSIAAARVSYTEYVILISIAIVAQVS